jgi:phosphoglycolate phosphatase-like HAD superfamily hydrolase
VEKLNPAGLQAVLFDFDGVLVESTAIKAEAFAALYRDRGEAIVARVVDYHVRHGGLSRYAKFRYFQEELLGGAPLDEIAIAKLDRRFSDLVADAVVACPAVAGAEALIGELSRQLPLFIVSATPEQELQGIVERRGWSSHFVEICGAPATKTELIAGILERHGLTPERVLMIGDALEDYRAAMANGVGFVGRVPAGEVSPFPQGVRVVGNLEDSGDDRLVPMLRDSGLEGQV